MQVRFKVAATEPGPFAIDLAFWSAEGDVLHTVPFQIHGDARK